MSDIFGTETSNGLFLPPGAVEVKPLDPTPTPTVDTVTTSVVTPTVDPAPAVAVAPDREFESALTDLALAGRVLSNISTSIEVVLSRVMDKKNEVEPAVATTNSDSDSVVTASTDTLSTREKAILKLLQSSTGKVVTNKQITAVVGSGSLSASISRIRKCGFVIESTQTIRKNGERIAKNLTGYRYSTATQANQRSRALRARSEIKNFLTSLIVEAFGV